jgi:hypothetical protein
VASLDLYGLHSQPFACAHLLPTFAAAAKYLSGQLEIMQRNANTPLLHHLSIPHNLILEGKVALYWATSAPNCGFNSDSTHDARGKRIP